LKEKSYRSELRPKETAQADKHPFKSKTDPREGLPPSLCSKSLAVVFLDGGKRFMKGLILDLKGWGNELKWPLKFRN
jgi:hypothetical protein